MPPIDLELIKFLVGGKYYAQWLDDLAAYFVGVTPEQAIEIISRVEGVDSRLIAANILENLTTNGNASEEKIGDLSVKGSTDESAIKKAERLRGSAPFGLFFAEIVPWGIA